MNSVALNCDVLFEIFSHFVSIDDAGPFTLILVSDFWRDAVIRHPPLWVWVTLGDADEDLEMKLHIYASLSANLPLHLILNVPLSDNLGRALAPFTPRIHDIFIEIHPEIKDNEAFQYVYRLVEDLGIRDTHISWTRKGKAVYLSPQNIMKKFSRFTRRSEGLDAKYPVNLITHFSLTGGAGPTFPLSQLMSWLSITKHLEYLVLSRLRIDDDMREYMASVSLPFLRELILEDIDSSTSTSTAVYLQIILCILYARLISVTLHGKLESIFNLLPSIIRLQPPRLRLIINGGNGEPVSQADHTLLLSFLRELSLELDQFSTTVNSDLSHVAKIIRLAPSTCTLRITISNVLFDLLRSLVGITQLLHVNYNVTRRRPHIYIPVAKNSISHGERHIPWMESLTIGGIVPFILDEVHLNALTPRARRFALSKTVETSLPISVLHSYLEESIDYSGYNIDLQIPKSKFDYSGHRLFKNLTTLVGTLTVISNVIKYSQLPVLNTIELLDPIVQPSYSEEPDGFGALIDSLTSPARKNHNPHHAPPSIVQNTIDNSAFPKQTDLTAEIKSQNARCPSLSRISFKFYPPWLELMKLLYFMVQYHKNSNDISIVTPSLPHQGFYVSLSLSSERRYTSHQRSMVSHRHLT